ncbi:hypothetical protein CC86DRAFT_472310 [Ophiobolus disseminans]|uniref:Uncharacterized protein n=1 Tax=Ophiobolus disseminans TaxID=1469910 RepID=A0A6A6ZDH0_9PLEO|nr:hypothetical protein CC86DRAFT_472310 [Ophiobolus disseminans]
MYAAPIDRKRLTDALKELQEAFGLSDDHFIRTENVGIRKAHPFKLYIGESSHEPFYVYLFETGRSQQMKIEIDSVDEGGDFFTPVNPQYFGTVQNLAYPFNEWLGAGRFLAAVKFYFLLGLKIGLYAKDPGFTVTKSWCRDLQGACDDLIAAYEEIARGKHGKGNSKSHKRRVPSTKSLSSPLTSDMPPKPRQPNMEAKKKKGAMEHRDDADDQQRQDLSPPHHGPQHLGYPPPFYDQPPPPSYFPTHPQFAPHPLGYYPPPQGYTNTFPQDHQYPQDYYNPPPFAVSSQYGSPAPSARDNEPRPPPLEGNRPPPSRKKSKKSMQKLTTPSTEMAAPTRARMKSDTSNSQPTSKPKAKIRHTSLDLEGELDDAARILERAGTERRPSTSATQQHKVASDLSSLEEEYRNLYQQREDVQTRMNAIRDRLTAEEYRDLVKKAEKPELTKFQGEDEGDD